MLGKWQFASLCGHSGLGQAEYPLLKTKRKERLPGCVSFWGVYMRQHALGGWKAVSNNAKMPGTGDY